MAGSGRRSADAVLALHLACGESVDSAAQKAGVGARTAWRRLEEPPFRAEISRLRAQMQERAVGLLADAGAEAAQTLRVLAERATSEAVRLGAARAILDLGMRLREQHEFEERLAAVEAGIAKGAA